MVASCLRRTVSDNTSLFSSCSQALPGNTRGHNSRQSLPDHRTHPGRAWVRELKTVSRRASITHRQRARETRPTIPIREREFSGLKINVADYSVFLIASLFIGGRPCTGGFNPGGNCGSGRANLMCVALLAFADVKASAATGVSSCQFDKSN